MYVPNELPERQRAPGLQFEGEGSRQAIHQANRLGPEGP